MPGGVHLFQAAHDFLGKGFHRQRCGKGLPPGRGCPRQLVGDDLVHAPDLFQNRPAQLPFIAFRFQLGAHHRQRGLQAVGKIGEGVAIALEPLAFGINEIVEVGGETREFGWIAVAKVFGGTALDAAEVGGNLAQRRHAPAQHRQQEQDQEYAKATQPGQQGAPEDLDLGLQGGGVFGDVDRQFQLRAIGDTPGDALGEHEQVALCRVHRSGELADSFFKLGGERQVKSECGGRAPLAILRVAHVVADDDRVESRSRSIKAWIRADFGWNQVAGTIGVRAGQIGMQVPLQALALRTQGGIEEGLVEGKERQAEKGREGDARRGQ